MQQKKVVTQSRKTPKMMLADNKKGVTTMSHYKHLTIEEREKLYLMRGQGASLRKIACELGRAASTLSREVKRNERTRHPYSPSQAQKAYVKRRKKCGRKHILSDPEKREYIRKFIQEAHWSPEQISNRLMLEHADLKISYAAIYRAIKAGIFDKNKRAASRKKELAFAYHLRRKGKKQHEKWDKRKSCVHFSDAYGIADRPHAANERREVGHFEADTVVGKRGGECLLSLVDRKSRFTLAAKLNRKTAEEVREGITALLGSLPKDKVKSITPDRGLEFALYQDISKALGGLPFYFADPHSPWQRGTNENTNGLIREILPKGYDMAHVSDEDIARFIFLLNLRPRKCLGWSSPAEVFFATVLHLT